MTFAPPWDLFFSSGRGREVLLGALLLVTSPLAGCREPRPRQEPVLSSSSPKPSSSSASWADVEKEARGQTVTWMMWKGDPLINAYVQGFVVPRLRDQYGVTLKTVSGQGNRIVSALMTEREAQKIESEFDLVWINGESFYQLRQIDALYGPFTERLPNFGLIDVSNPFIGSDFQQPIGGYECPWGNVQMTLIYHSDRVKDPPRTREALAAWARAHPGRFTFDASFTGMTLLKSWLIALAGGAGALDGPFDEAKYVRYSAELWKYLKVLKPYLWRRGETYPQGVAELHQLFASGEIDFTMSNNDGEVDNKILQGALPEASRAYVFDEGMIQNSHYIGIVRNAPHLAAALVAANFLISPEAQYEKMKPAVWGDGTVLNRGRLSAAWRAKFDDVPGRRFAPPRAELEKKALREIAPEYMIRIADDFRRHALR